MEVGFPELFVVLFVVLLFVGPGKIANLGRDLGTGIREFRQGLSGKAEQPAAPETNPDN